MGGISIRRGRESDSRQFIGLVRDLADFEHLEPPGEAARKRLLDDLFRRRRLFLFVASEGEKLVGYALYFFTYSSFLAKPTLYLEDLYVMSDYRKRGAGRALLGRLVREAVSRGCGRMEWAVLTWNERAMRFYEKLGARRMSDWYVYRLDEAALGRLASGGRPAGP